jgi:hypothetical protein
MSTNEQVAATQQPSTRGGDRGRGNRGGGRSARNTSRAAVAKAATAKVGPNRLLETDWVKDASLADASFVIIVVSGKAGDQQWTYHRPIGETSLTGRQWVATPTRDIVFLLQRKENEALTAWKRQSELAKRQAVLRAAHGRRLDPEDGTEVWSFDGAPAIQPTIRTCMTAAKAAGAKDSEWLNYADSAVQTAERTFKQALRTTGVPAGWLRAHAKPTYETKGGALGDVPQKAVEYLNGLSLAAARDKVTRVAIGLDIADPLPLPEEDDSESEAEDDPPAPAEQPEGNTPKAARTPSPKGKAAKAN